LQLGIAIEVELLKETTRLGTTIDEINADTVAYGKAYSAVIFVVYELSGTIRDDAEFRRDLEASDGVRALVIEH
jgi:hypothetical protein